MTRTGIFGGSFNPIHNGHIALARELLERAHLDEIWFVVSPQNPLKQQSELLPDALRLKMVQEVLQQETRLLASDYEFHLPRPSYTWNTLQHLSQDYPDRQFILIIGADNWAHFDKWYRGDDIVSQYDVIVYPRQGSVLSHDQLPARVTIVDTPLYTVSSTEVRQLVQQGKHIGHLVPTQLTDTIQKNYEDFINDK
jgi:nicotinate-nucleotide adenylyltransferase